MLLELEEQDSSSSTLLETLATLLPTSQDYFMSNDSIAALDYILFARVHHSHVLKPDTLLKPNLLAWYNRMKLNQVCIDAIKVLLCNIYFNDLKDLE